MILYKNVDVQDLENILKVGIIPMSEVGFNNWDEGKRAKNSREVVYLFSPLTEINTFPQYGIVLLEIECSIADESSISVGDQHSALYKEYVTDRVNSSEIKNIYVPAIFKDRIDRWSKATLDKVKWVDMQANHYDNEKGYINASEDVLNKFGQTAVIVNGFNFFRGTEKQRIIDLYEVIYKL